jgi:hypothetical protein
MSQKQNVKDKRPFEPKRSHMYLNPELFKEDVNKDLVEKSIIKTTAILGSRMRFDLKPNMAVELMRRYKGLGML